MKANDIQRVLEGVGYRPTATPRPAAEFWRDFRARVEAAPDRTVRLPGTFRVPKRMAWFAGPALAAAAAVLVAVFWTGSGTVAAVDAVQSYRVGDDVVHGGVMILNDEPSHATILWIADLAENA